MTLPFRTEAEGLKLRPHASAIPREEMSKRKGLSGARPLSRVSAASPSGVGSEPNPYTVSVG